MNGATTDGERGTLIGQLLDELFPFALPTGTLPDPTLSEGPDPYGNPDGEWLRVDWRSHLRSVDVPMRGEEAIPGRPAPEGDARRTAGEGGAPLA